MNREQLIPLCSPRMDIIKTNKGAMLKLMGRNIVIYISQTEALFLSLCDGQKTLGEIADKISQLYEIEWKKVMNDLILLVEKYKKSNLLNIIPQKLKKRLSMVENEEEFIFVPDINSNLIIPRKINSIGFELTNECFCNCSYCFGNFGKNEKNYLPTEKVISVVKEAEKLGKVEYVTLSGGDPILHPGLPEIIKFLEDRRISYEVSTKGILLNEAKIKELSKAGLRKIQISIDAWNPEVWSKIVGLPKGNFNNVIEAFYLCKKYKIEVRARVTLIRENVNEVEPLLNNLPFLGIREIRMVTLLPVGRGKKQQCLNAEETEMIQRVSKEFSKKNNDEIKVIIGLQKYTYSIMCGGARLGPHICADGEVILCDAVGGLNRKKYSYGNIFKNSIQEIWFSEEANRLRYNSEIKTCNNCERFSYCNGGCRAIADSYYEKENMPDPRCPRISGKEKENFIFTWKR